VKAFGNGAVMTIGSVILGLSLWGATVSPQIGPDPASGHRPAEKLRVSCYIVDKEAEKGTVLPYVPSFATIEKRPNQTIEAIAGRIVIPHPPMPNIQLSRAEIADLAAYILSLKQP
jgi:hypothetical protein